MANIVLDFLHNYQTGERRETEPANAYQYDEGHVLEAVLPEVITSCEIHYWIRGMEEADAYTPTSITPNADNSCTVLGNIPNSYFETNGELRIYIVVTDGTASITTYEGKLHICQRSMPDDYVDDDPENEATRIMTEARAAAATATAAAQTAQDVADSIPSDYSQLSEDVDTLKEEIITPEQQSLLISILRKAIYDGNQQELIDTLEDSFSGIVHVTGIAFTQASISITDVEPVTASYTITPADGTDPILWASSDQNVVTVSNGVITPVGDGSATITAYTSRGISATLSVTVDLPATYSVTNNLTNATNSNSSALIVEGNSYTGVITADNGYVVNSVTVTMGGTDVTSTVYANGTISIASVTGDIVITVATVIAPPTPVYKGENLVFDGTASTVIDTGIKLCDTDKDMTVVVKFDTPITTTLLTTACDLFSCAAGSTGNDGYVIRRNNSGNPTTMYAFGTNGDPGFTDAFNALEGETQALIIRHRASSGTVEFSGKTYKNNAKSVGKTSKAVTFAAHENTAIIGARRWNGINSFAKGTIKLVEIYDKYLTDEQIAGYYE